MKRFFAIGCFSLTIMFGSLAFGAEQKIAQIQLPELSKEQWNEVKKLGLDHDICGGHTDIFANESQLAKLRELGIEFHTEVKDLRAFYQSRNTAAVDFGGFRTFTQIEAYLDSLTIAHPTLCSQKFSAGQTLEGRQMWVIKISDNHTVDENEPEVFYNALIHAREPAAGASLLHFMAHLLTNYGTDAVVTDIVNNRELYFMPVVNPDGYVHNENINPLGGGLWRKNRRNNGDGNFGVDLNRNYSHEWGIDDVGSSGVTASEVYRGASPFSEPETQNIRDFIVSRQFVIVNNIHCYSDLLLWPWGGSDRTYTPQESFYKAVGDSAVKFNGYAPGVGWGLYPTNGAADDWMWGDTILKSRIISFTTEIGGNSDGFWPDPARIPALVAENVWPNIFLAKITGNPYLYAQPLAPTVTLPDSVSEDFSLSWQDVDPINPALTYRISELKNKSTVTDNVEVVTNDWSPLRFNRSTTRAHGGTFSWKTTNTNFAPHWLISRSPYEVKTNDSLVFWVWYNVEANYDYFYAQVSTDGGFAYTSLSNNLTTNTNPNNVNLGNGMTGSSGGWVRAAFDLSPYSGQQVLFRLALLTDNGTLGEGVYVDDFANIDLFGIETELFSALADTTLSFIDKAPGDYWYKIKAKDAQGQEGLYSQLVKTNVTVPFVLGDFDGDAVVDISDLTDLISYLFLGGPPPSPESRLELDCIAPVDISDLTALIDYLFISLSPLSCP